MQHYPLRAIAEKLRYAHAALYRYFPDKASLLAEICRDTFSSLITELDLQQNKAQGPEAQLLAVSLGFVRFGLAHPYHFNVLFSGPENRHGIGGKQHIDAIGRPLLERFVHTFLACSEAVGLNPTTRMLDAQTWWISLFGTTHILVASCAAFSPLSSDEVVQRHTEVMWKGIQAASASTPADPALRQIRDKKRLAAKPRLTG